MLQVGPGTFRFAARREHVEMMHLSSRGKKSINLFFYPRDGSPGCIISKRLQRPRAGVRQARHRSSSASRDDVLSRAAFRDAEQGLCPCSCFGRSRGRVPQVRVVVRSSTGAATFVAFHLRHRQEGSTAISSDVSPKDHADEVLKAVRTSMAAH